MTKRNNELCTGLAKTIDLEAVTFETNVDLHNP